MLFIRAIPFSSLQQSGEVTDTQQGCLIPFAKIREMVCLRLGAGNALLGGGKLSEKQRLYVGCVTDSCLACSTPDTGESSVWTCCGMANGGRNGIFLPQGLDLKYIISASHTWKMCVCAYEL